MTVCVAVAAASDPANHIVLVGGRKRHYLDKLVLYLLARQLHEDEIRLKRFSLLLLLLTVQSDLARHAPHIVALEEDARVRRVIKAEDIALRFNQCFGITNVSAQIRRHLARIFEER